MRKRTLLGLALAGVAAAMVWRRSSDGQTNETAELSPINEEVPGDEPIAEEDVPEDRAR